MKILFLFLCCLFSMLLATAQNNVGIGTTTPDSSAVLDIRSANKGLLIPRMTSGKRDSLPKLSNGLLLYNTTDQAFQYLRSDTLSTPIITQLGGRTQFNNVPGSSAGSTSVSIASSQNYFQTLAVQTANTSIDQIKLKVDNSVTSCDNVSPINSVIEVYRGVINDGVADVLVGTLNATIPRISSTQLITWSATQSIPISANINYYFRCYVTGSACSSGGVPNFFPIMDYASGWPSSQRGYLTTLADLQTSVPGRAVYFEVWSNLQTISTNVLNNWQTINTSAVQQLFASASNNGILSSQDWNTFNNKSSFNLPSLTSGSLLFSNGSTIAQNNSKLYWDNATNRLGIGTTNTIGTVTINSTSDGITTPFAPTLTVNSQNPGYSTSDWIAANFGGQANDRVVMGILNGEATIGAHTNLLDGWSTLTINPEGLIRLPFYRGIGNQMLVVAPDGFMVAAPAPTLRSVAVEAPLQVANATTVPYIAMPPATASANGYLTSIDWNTFNSKQNKLVKASATDSGYLSSADWVRFNNNTATPLTRASATDSGYITSADWNTFNNKFTLPALTSGSIVYSNGTTLAQNNTAFRWNNSIGRLSINSINDGTINDTTGGFNNWIATSIGGTGGDRVVMGVANGKATIGAHNNNLNSWTDLILNPGNNVGIGTYTPNYTLHVNGTIAGTSAYTNLSDARFKTNVQAIQNPLQKILALRGVTYNWDLAKAGDKKLDNKNHIGFLAQEVEKVLPQVVSTAADTDKTKTVAYSDVIPVLVEAIKELKKLQEQSDKKIELLQQEIEKLKVKK